MCPAGRVGVCPVKQGLTMSKDISSLLHGWDYDPDQLKVRLITGDDGTPKVQIRIDLGVMQMELDGRPDGERPHGFESFLAYYKQKIAEHQAKTAEDEGFRLDPEDCAKLMQEGLQYYHRYLALFQLDRFEPVVRDTSRNLDLFATVAKYAERDEDRVRFDQYRPYVIMMNVRARAGLALAQEDHQAAAGAIDDGVRQIHEFLDEYGRQDDTDNCWELQFLLKWRARVEQERPLTPIETLQAELDKAVALEDFERAAALRDEIRRLQQHIDPFSDN